MQKHDGGGFDALRSQFATDCARCILVERGEHGTVVADAFGHFEDAVARDERYVLSEEQVERVRPIDPADLVDVAKALGRYERGARALPFENRVDRYGRTVDDELGRCGRGTRNVNRVEYTDYKIVRGGEGLAEAYQTRRRIENRRVGKRSADIDADPKAAGRVLRCTCVGF
jgi:hypothetical protein